MISKDDDLASCAPVVGFEILKALQNSDQKKLSISEISNKLKAKNKANVRTLYFGLIFLYSAGLIDLTPPYVVLNVQTDKTL